MSVATGVCWTVAVGTTSQAHPGLWTWHPACPTIGVEERAATVVAACSRVALGRIYWLDGIRKPTFQVSE
jgi:hypothetical protein